MAATLASGSEDGVYLWDAVTGEKKHLFIRAYGRGRQA